MLQFQATQVTNSVSKLMVSLIPADVGQPTVKLGKVPVAEGICTWKNPIYETVKFTRDAKTKTLQDKIYFFSVATGSSKKSFLGEIGINLVDYIDAITPVTVDLPIEGSKASVVLHVTVQNMEGTRDQRDVKENGELGVQSERMSFQSQLSISRSDNSKDDNYFLEDTYRIETVPQQDERRNYADCSTAKTRQPLKLDWSSDDDELLSYVKSGEDNKGPKGYQQHTSESLVEQLRKEISTLQRQAELSEVETQTLRRQIVKETKSKQELNEKIVSLQEERDALKVECELKSQRKSENGGRFANDIEDDGKPTPRLKEIEQEITHDNASMKKLRWQLQKTQDSNSELILTVRDLEEILKKKDKEISHLSTKLRSRRKDDEFYSDSDHSLESDKQREVFRGSVPSKYKSEDVSILEQKIADLQGELDDQLRDRMDLENRIDQLTEDYETTKRENHDISMKLIQMQQEATAKENQCEEYLRMIEDLESQLTRLEKVIQKQAEEFYESAEVIRELENEVKTLDAELAKRTQQFENDLRENVNARHELEERALQAEEDLREEKVNNAVAAQRLQDFEKLSLDLATKFEENEKSTLKAQDEATEQRAQVEVLEQRIQKANEELELMKNLHKSEVQTLSNELLEKEKQLQQLSNELEREGLELRTAKQKVEKCEVFLKENQTLRTEIERLAEENYHFSKQSEEAQDLTHEMELMKSSVGQTEKLLELSNKERDQLEREHTLLRTEAKQLQDSLNEMRLIKEKREQMVEALQSEMGQLRAEHGKLKNDFLDEKGECENLRKQLIQHKKDTQKKNHVPAQMEEQLQMSNSKETLARKQKLKQIKAAAKSTGMSPENGNTVDERRLPGSVISSQNGANRTSGKSKRETCLPKIQKDSTVESNNESNLTQLLSEVALLKEKNKSMEDELKEMQEKYSDVSLRFAEVEGERQQLVMTVRNLRNGQKR